MNREILFRGKRVDNGEWIEGYCVRLNNKAYIAIIKRLQNDEEVLIYVEVIPETVGQYTGLTDKNGRKIFEEDILVTNKFRTPEVKYAVVYDKEIATYIGACKRGYTENFTTFCDDGDEFEVIGNIHDNPELLDEPKGDK